MGNFLEELGDDDRSPLPYRERRELTRRKGQVNGALDLYRRKVDAVNDGTTYQLQGIQRVARRAEDVAREGPIQAALVARKMARYDSDLEILDSDFIRDIQGS